VTTGRRPGEQQAPLDAPRRRYSLAARVLFVTMDLLRQIGHDERMHKQRSEAYLVAAPLR
jgi:hypothetical protein